MTKVINKKAIMILFTLVLAFCWLAVPVSAAETESYEDYIAEGASITRIGDVASPQWGGDIYSLKLEEFTLRAFGGYNSSGKPIEIEIYDEYGNAEYGYVEGPADWMYCKLSDTFYYGMVNANLNTFICHLRFSVDGTQLQRYTVKVDDVTIVDTKLNVPGEYEVSWLSPRKLDTDFCVSATTLSTGATVWGRYRADAYYD